MVKECRECGLSIRTPFKQVVQLDNDVCEECHIVVLGLQEFSDDEKVTNRKKKNK